MRSSYEYMNYLQVVQVLRRTPSGSVLSDSQHSRTKLQAMQSDFNLQVGKQYGLTHQAQPKRLNVALSREVALSVLHAIKANHGLLNKPGVLQALIDAIAANPEPAAMALGLNMPKPKTKKKAFVEIMTQPVKQEKPIGFERKNPIGFASIAPLGKYQTLCSVGFAISKAPIQANEPQQTDQTDSYQRISDKPTQPGYWCETRGEWITQPVKQSNKLTAVISARRH